MLRGPIEWHYLRTEIHEGLLHFSKFISGGHTRQAGDLIRLNSFLESRLKMHITAFKNVPYFHIHTIVVMCQQQIKTKPTDWNES
jgi:hypothetical protein